MVKNLSGWASKLAVLVHALADGVSLGCTLFPFLLSRSHSISMVPLLLQPRFSLNP